MATGFWMAKEIGAFEKQGIHAELIYISSGPVVIQALIGGDLQGGSAATNAVINAVLNGISGAQSLREVLARLETKQQAIIMGHAVPMPVVIKPRNYDAAFYAAVMNTQAAPVLTAQPKQSLGNSGKKRL